MIRKYTSILITGAGSGIGEAIAYQFAKQNCKLMLVGRNTEKLAQVCSKCNALQAETSYMQVDFSDTNSINSFIEKIEALHIKFDCLVLNAGISQRALTLDTDFLVDKKIMDTNFFGPIYLVKKLGNMLRSNAHTSIAITSSISGLFGFPLRSSYCASKHALFGFFEALDLENKNINVTFLIPGRINTPISKSAVLAKGEAYNQMDSGQANGMDVNKCATIAVRAIEKGTRRKLIGGKELLMVYFKKWCPPLFWKLAQNISAT